MKKSQSSVNIFNNPMKRGRGKQWVSKLNSKYLGVEASASFCIYIITVAFLLLFHEVYSSTFDVISIFDTAQQYRRYQMILVWFS